MKRESKTLIEIFDEKYPISKMKENPLIAVESLGYLNCLEQFQPTLSKEITSRIVVATTIVTSFVDTVLEVLDEK